MDDNPSLQKAVRDIGVIAHSAESANLTTQEICWIANDLERVSIELRAIARSMAGQPVRRKRRGRPAAGGASAPPGAEPPVDPPAEPPSEDAAGDAPPEPIQRRRRQP